MPEIPGTGWAIGDGKESWGDWFSGYGDRVAAGNSGGGGGQRVQPGIQPGGISTLPRPGSALGRSAGSAFSPTPQRTGLSQGEFRSLYDSFLNQARADNAGAWAAQQSALSSLLDEGNQRRIAADYSRLGTAVDSRLRDQLLARLKQGDAVTFQDFADRDAALRQFADLNERGIQADDALLNQQDDFLLQQLMLEKQRTEQGRKEGRNTRETNVRNVYGQGTAAGARFSSAVDTMVSDEDRNLALLMERATNADAQTQKEYDASMADWKRRILGIKETRDKNQLDLIYGLAGNQRGREKVLIDQASQIERARAEAEKARIAQQAQDAQLAAFFRGVQQQQTEAFFARLQQEAQLQQGALGGALGAGGVPVPAAGSAFGRGFGALTRAAKPSMFRFGR